MRSRAGLAVAAATWVGVVCGVWLSSGVGIAAQGGRTVWDGAYTDDQAARGKKQYIDSCSSCHKEGLQGADLAPALKGEDFVLRWTGYSLQDVFMTISTLMPADAPGTLTPQANVDIIAFILQVNKFPAGHDELKPEPTAMKGIAVGPKP